MNEIRVADYISQRLGVLGVDTCFLVTGGGAMHLNDAIGATPSLRKIYCHHEQAAAIAADAYARTIPLAERWEAGVRRAIERHRAPWYVTRLGCRAEYHFQPVPARTGREHAASNDASWSASCTSTPSTAGSCSRRSTTWRS